MVFYCNTDGGSTNIGSGTGKNARIGFHFHQLDEPSSSHIHYAFNLSNFPITSNQTEYQAIIAALQFSWHLKLPNLTILSDSQLCVNHIIKAVVDPARGYSCTHPNLTSLLKVAKRLIRQQFPDDGTFYIHHISRDQNTLADWLAGEAHKLKSIDKLPSTWNHEDVVRMIEHKYKGRI